MYDELKKQILEDEDTDFDSVSDTTIAEIESDYPEIPQDYIAFLREVGWGAIAMCYVIYRSPKTFGEVYDAATPQDIILIGDNMSGRCIGFDKWTWNIVEVQNTGKVVPMDSSFSQAISEICYEIFEEED
ncbi:hypothetical protein [Stieleria maiorica]|uniref:hypothetical protein n=1 Tax=Stieleria maiorica TaxID=2795974 RepID=UPI0011CAADCF|nr:hypothetical protein [Stieleria maiorica]